MKRFSTYIKRFIATVTAFALFFAGLTLADSDRVFGASLQDILDKANKELGEVIFTESKNGKKLNVKLATEGISVDGSEKKPIFVYGSEVEASDLLGINPEYKYVNGDKMYRALGFTINDKYFPHPDFPEDIQRVEGRNTRWYTYDELVFGTEKDIFHHAINRWLGSDMNERPSKFQQKLNPETFNPENIKGLHIELKHRSGLTPDHEDYLDLSKIGYIIQPPTEDSWGLVVFFHYDQVEDVLLYSAATMKPPSLYEGKDLSEDIDNGGGDGFIIDYNVLQRRIEFELGESKAQFSPSGRDWRDAATGRLNVYNDTPHLYKDFKVSDNPDVNEYSTTIRRNPIINTQIRRQDFVAANGAVDNPLERQYGVTNSKVGLVRTDGSVQRSYSYYCGGKFCTGHTATATAYFDRIVNRQYLTVNVYNGQEQITPPIFKKGVERVGGSDLKQQLWWTSKPFNFNVVRLMYHQNEDDSLDKDSETAVGGQYQRIFTNQDEALITWSVQSAIDQEYKTDRDKAKNRDYKVSGKEKAVFASDVIHKNKDYPIRSGYYFNPGGSYNFEITTHLYKNTTDDTSEHKALVEALTKAFRYESDMVYINQDRKAVTIAGTPVSLTGAAYAAKADYITTDNSPYFNIKVDKNHEKTFEELYHNYTEDGTDLRFKKVLEGYADSGTGNSKSAYKYVEYPRTDVTAYRVTETTKVTITVNPDNKKLYTHVIMKNGSYNIRAYVDAVALRGITDGQLSSVEGINRLDGIRVEVVGSMYDDSY